jgi:hypothetical protein
LTDERHPLMMPIDRADQGSKDSLALLSAAAYGGAVQDRR